MPIYEFGCRRCGHRFEELFLGGADVSSVRCPECRSKRVQRRASAFFARSGGGDGGGKSLGGGHCGGCHAASCAGCRH